MAASGGLVMDGFGACAKIKRMCRDTSMLVVQRCQALGLAHSSTCGG